MAQQYDLPQLPYSLDAFEPILSKELMELHYSKHHAGYVTNLNKALKQLEEAESKRDLVQQLSLQSALAFNGGGHINHSLFWENLLPPSQGGGVLQNGPLLEALVKTFGSLDACTEQVMTKAASIQGSGWSWLGYSRERKSIEIAETKNHGLLIAKTGLLPLLCIDVWEHAYYLQYKNVKGQYLKSLWSAINWNVVEKRFLAALS